MPRMQISSMSKQKIISVLKKVESPEDEFIQHQDTIIRVLTERRNTEMGLSYSLILNDSGKQEYHYFVKAPIFDAQYETRRMILKSKSKYVIARRLRKFAQRMMKQHRAIRESFKDVTSMQQITEKEYWDIKFDLQLALDLPLIDLEYDNVTLIALAPVDKSVQKIALHAHEIKIQPLLIKMGDIYLKRLNPINLDITGIRDKHMDSFKKNRHFPYESNVEIFIDPITR